MKITYPHTIENGLGEKIIFHSVQKEPGLWENIKSLKMHPSW